MKAMTNTAWFERVDTDRITERARQVRFTEGLLRFIAGFFFLIGWVTAKVFSVIWFATVWCCVAVAEGWREGRKTARRPGG